MSKSTSAAAQERILDAAAAEAKAEAKEKKGGGRLGVKKLLEDEGGGAASGGADVYDDDGGRGGGGGRDGGVSSDSYESYTGSDTDSDGPPDTPRTAARKAARKQWERMFEECSLEDARALSRAEREEKMLTHASLAYGEPTFDAMWDIFQSLDELDERPASGNCYDLGAGTGRAALAMVLAHDFHKVRGVELLESLHSASIDVLERFNVQGLPGLGAAKLACDVRFLRGDIRETQWADATFVFASWTCFNEQLVRHITMQARDVRAGCLFVAVTKPLDDPARWTTLDQAERQMSWGAAEVFVHKRKTPEEERAYRATAGSGRVDDDEGLELLRPTAGNYPSTHRVGTRYRSSDDDED